MDINSFINELHFNTSKQINQTWQSLIDIKNYVESKINIENIREYIKLIINLILITSRVIWWNQ